MADTQTTNGDIKMAFSLEFDNIDCNCGLPTIKINPVKISGEQTISKYNGLLVSVTIRKKGLSISSRRGRFGLRKVLLESKTFNLY